MALIFLQPMLLAPRGLLYDVNGETHTAKKGVFFMIIQFIRYR